MIDQLLFFDKDGYALNFPYQSDVEKYEGKLLFHENGTDTFKTLIINMFERIRPFEYSQGNDLDLQRWQLFNQNGTFLNAKTFENLPITNIEKTNNSNQFFSKWVHGDGFDNKFPVGTEVYFTATGIPDFTSGINLKTFTVISTKRDAIMVITATDNATYSNIFVTGNIFSLNTIRVHDYLTLSAWNELSFETFLYPNRKISLIGSNNNEGVYTVDTNFIDVKNVNYTTFNYSSMTMLDARDFLSCELKLLTDRIFVTTQNVTFVANRNKISFQSGVPAILKPNTDFIFDTGLANSNITFTINDQIAPTWNNLATYNLNELVYYFGDYYKSLFPLNVNNQPNGSFWTLYDLNWVTTYNYTIGDIVKYQNSYYRALTNNINILPTNITNWTTVLLDVYVQQAVINEGPVTGTAYLTTTTVNLSQFFDTNNDITVYNFVDKYQETFKNYNIDLYYDTISTKLISRNLYAHNYTDINFYENKYFTNWNATTSYVIGQYVKFANLYYVAILNNIALPPNLNPLSWTLTNVKNLLSSTTPVSDYHINLKEQLIKEGGYTNGYLEYAKAANLNQYIITFNNIDSFGLNITINGILYSVPFDTNTVNTLTDWVTLYTTTLTALGINVSNVGADLTIFTDYPNVGLQFEIQLGTTGDYIVKHSMVQFVDPNLLFQQLLITINGVEYFETFNTNIVTTLANWVNNYKFILADLGIIVTSNGLSQLFFNLTEQIIPINYTINTGHAYVDDILQYKINNYITGENNILLSSNQIINTNIGVDLQTVGFATAMILTLKNSIKPLNNQEYNILLLDADKMVLSYQGPFWSDTTSILEISTREFLRQPRFGFDNDPKAKFRVQWKDDTTPELFLYDFSGKMLETSGPFAYTGVLPLITTETQFLPDHQLSLRLEANKDLDKVNIPKYQQTVFDIIDFELDLVDSPTDLTVEPEALPIFIGFNDKEEGTVNNTLQVFFVEDRQLVINTDPVLPLHILNFNTIDNQIEITTSSLYFTNFGFSAGQIISINGFDNTNTYNQSKLKNNGKKFYIKAVYSTIIIIDPDKSPDVMENETSLTSIINAKPPFNPIATGFTITIKVEPKEILNVQIYGETEAEDVRFRVALNNVGHNIKERDSFIFKEYDINEQGIDWIYLNRKRKEMLMVQPEIFNYVGAYKALVNSINYFGYNDLELYEYYRNINPDSQNYKKLHKLEIPDIFDNSVPGWNENDYLKNTLPNKNYVKTKLFNLTYRITDREGNNVLAYSLQEVIVKLTGLKRWLKENVLPIGTKILDITGRADTVVNLNYIHGGNFDKHVKNHNTITPVTFVAEGYKQPISMGSSLYNIHLDFKTLDNTIPELWSLQIDTYETHPYWDVTITYNIGDRVVFFGRIYKSIVNNNLSIRPNTDALSWIEEQMVKVQSINEFKTDLNAYNFAADKDVDPFIIIKATTYDGYGAAYCYKKYYSLDGVYLVTSKLDPANLLSAFDPGFNNGFGV